MYLVLLVFYLKVGVKTMAKGNINNLIPNSERTPEQLKAMTTKAGKRSGEVRRQKKSIKEQLQLLMSLPVKNPKNIAQIKGLGITESDIDNQMAMNVAMLSLILKGGKGSVQAYNTITDILGENEKKQLELQKAREEIERLKLEQEKLKRELGNGKDDFEDLTPLAELLKGDSNADDTMGSV